MTISRCSSYRRFAALALLLGGLLLGAMPLRAAPLGGTLTGKVVMKTAGASLPTNPLTVTLLFFNGGLFRVTDEAVDFKTTTTAPDGSFTFAGLDTTAGGAYRVVVAYKGVQYEPAERDVTDQTGAATKTRAVRFENNATTAAVEVPIYEPVVASGDPPFTVKSQQIIMNEIRPSFYNVLEVLQVTNPGDRTLVGALAPDGTAGQGVPVVFTAPPGATGITTNRTDLLVGADLTGQKLTLRLPLPPGSTDVTMTYSMQGVGTSGLLFQRTLDYATPQVQALVSDARQAIASRTLADAGPLQAPQATAAFRKFTLDNASAGKQIDLMIAPSPAAPPRAQTPAPEPNFFERLRDRASVPVLLGLAGVCLVLLVLVLRLPVRGQGTGDRGQGAGQGDAGTADAPEPAVMPKAGGVPDREMDEDEAEIAAANADEEPEPSTRTGAKRR